MKFEKFNKIPRLSREMVITEKIDGTNASITIWNAIDVDEIHDGMICLSRNGLEYFMCAASRNKWISPEKDNAGFARWVSEHAEDLLSLGVGTHYGEWWGSGIQRRYDLDEKRFSLFNTHRWADNGADVRPTCCHVVPILYTGMFDTEVVDDILKQLNLTGSIASPGFMNPEGIVVFHTASNYLFKKTIEKDEMPKSIRKGE